MSYPFPSIVWIAPTLYLLLIVGIPVIGVFAGWKRAAYWGGGTLFFFIIGSIIWRFAGSSIAAWVDPLLTKLIHSISPSVTISQRLLVSVCAPLFFLSTMLITEIILVINYYAWFKKVSGIKKDIEIQKAYKLLKTEQAKKKEVAKHTGWKQMQLTTKGKVINMTCGGVGLAALLVPSTVTFSQAMFYMTTSVETRALSGFVSGLYGSLQWPVEPFDWMSYYVGGDSSKDFNSIFSLLNLSTEEVEYTYFDSNGNEQQGSGTLTDALTDVVSGGVQTLIKKATDGDKTTAQKVADADASITSLALQWNSIVVPKTESVNSVFSSESVSEILKSIINDNIKSKQQLTKDQIVKNYLTEGSVFDQVYNNYFQRSESEKLVQIPVSEETFENIAESFTGAFIFTDDVTTEIKYQFFEKIEGIASLMFKVV